MMKSSKSVFNINRSTLTSTSDVNVHCRACGLYLFNASDLRYREPNYVCDSRNFSIERSSVNEEKKTIQCANDSCSQELGRLIEMRKYLPLYVVDIKGIKFEMPGKADFVVFKQWSQAGQFMAIKMFKDNNFC